MTTTTLLLIHFDQRALGLYLEALRPLSGLSIHPLHYGAFSSAYTRRAAELRGRPGGRLLPALLESLGLDARAAGDVILWSYSAGYALVRELLRHSEDAAQVSGWIGVDSGHAALEADGTALDAQVRPFASLAQRAARGEALCWMGYSDVPTPQRGPQAFASTTQFAAELERLAGVEMTQAPNASSGNALFFVRGYDVRKDPAEEHRSALLEWGPQFTLAALAAWRASRSTLLSIPAQTKEPALPTKQEAAGLAGARPTADRLIAFARGELAARVREEWGPNDGARIRQYLSGTTRGGRLTGLQRVAWCAAFVGAGLFAEDVAAALRWDAEAYRAGREPSPVGWRAAVRELVEDARACGVWYGLDERPDFAPWPGDLAVFTRAGGDPRRGGTGHVSVIVDVSRAGMVTIGGNEGDAVRQRAVSWADPELVGFVAVD